LTVQGKRVIVHLDGDDVEKLPKVAKAEDTILTKPIEIDTPLINGIVPVGTEIKKVRVIAGYGTSTEFRNAEQYALKFGGNADKWQKKGGVASTDNFNYDIHWCEYDGKQYNHKLKGVKPI
jgi:hypothetical protein